jgi:hypothetical protein
VPIGRPNIRFIEVLPNAVLANALNTLPNQPLRMAFFLVLKTTTAQVMRLKILSIVVLSFLCFQSEQVKGQAAIIALLFGDQVASEKFNISLEFGVNQPFYSNLPDSRRSRLGINFGIGANIQLSDNWFLCPNAYFLAARRVGLNSFTPTTGKIPIDDSFANAETEMLLKYIDVPIFLHYQTDNKKFRFGLAPQVSFSTSAVAMFEGGEGDFEQDISDDIHALDYGLIGNFTYVLGKAYKGRGIHLHLRYYYGFQDVFKDDYIDGNNHTQFISAHLSLPFITDELAEKNLRELE